MGPCNLCEECSTEIHKCKNPKLARPTLEAMGVDVFKTVRDFGFQINVLTDYSQSMDRFGFLLIE